MFDVCCESVVTACHPNTHSFWLADLIAKDLLEQTDNQYNGTALYWMCVNGEITMVTALLDRGADPNTSNSYRHTPLHAAADMEYVTIVKLLLK